LNKIIINGEKEKGSVQEMKNLLVSFLKISLENNGMALVCFLRNEFAHFVIPDLIRNPVFSIWIPAGVYPVLDTGRE
jgi:hypothetical protein